MSEALILARAAHLLATILLTGAVIFRVLVAEPALGGKGESLLARLRFVLRRLVAVNLGIAVASGAAWLVLLVASLGEASIAEVGERAWIFLTQTQFGITSLLRLALALLLAVALAGCGATGMRLRCRGPSFSARARHLPERSPGRGMAARRRARPA